MKVLGVLQNIWVKDPKRVKAMIKRHPERRQEYMARLLFMGGKTGNVLMSIFGNDICNKIIWEESSKEIGGFAASKFPADISHLFEIMEIHKPDIIIGFGNIACRGLQKVVPSGISLIQTIHPAARQATVYKDLNHAKETLEHLLNNRTSTRKYE